VASLGFAATLRAVHLSIYRCDAAGVIEQFFAVSQITASPVGLVCENHKSPDPMSPWTGAARWSTTSAVSKMGCVGVGVRSIVVRALSDGR
jgi:hypothetical protein